MSEVEIIEELLEFLDSTGQFRNFLAHAEARGFDPDDLEKSIESVIGED